MAPFSAFPSEILSLIVEYLTDRRDLYACMVMNKQLYKVTQLLLWRTPQLHDETAADQFYTGLTVTSCSKTSPLTSHHDPEFGVGPWIRKLKLHDTFWTDPRLLVLIPHVRNLEELDLTYTTELTDESLALLPQNCLKLKTLRLVGVPGITQLFMEALGLYCHQITKLTIHECYRLGGDTYVALQHCTLHSLAIGLPSPSMQSNMASWDLIIHHPWLTTLSLNFWKHSSSSLKGSSNGGNGFMKSLFADAVGAWPHLTSLSIANYTVTVPFHRRFRGAGGWDDPLVTFLQHHLELQTLSLRAINLPNSNRNMGGLSDVALPYLTQLTITNTPDLCARELERWILVCPQLVFVCFWGSSIIPPRSIGMGPVIDCGSPQHCRPPYQGPFLHHLDQEDILKLRFTSEASQLTR